MNKEIKTLDTIIKAYSKKKINNKKKRDKIYITIINLCVADAEFFCHYRSH